MANRLLLGFHPASGDCGFWITKPGYNVLTADRTSRAQFLFSTDFGSQRPLRVIKSGMIASNTNIPLPGKVSSLGGEPLLFYRVMETASRERENGWFGNTAAPGGDAYGYSEFYSHFFTGSSFDYYKIYCTSNEASTAYTLRYAIAIF